MKPAVLKSADCVFLALTFLLANPGFARSQDPKAAAPTAQNQKKRMAENNAKKAAEQEEKGLKEAAEQERKEAETAAREREKTTARLIAAESQAKVEGPIASGQAPTREQERIQQAEAKARKEAEKARKQEEDRARSQEAKDAEQRRKNEERAAREAAKARESQDRTRADSLQKEYEQRDKAPKQGAGGATPETAQQSGASPRPTPVPYPAPSTPTGKPPGKASEQQRKELVKQIEKARADRDGLSREADEAERLARAARTAANEGQRAYEAMTTGLGIEDVAVLAAPAPADGAPRKNRFVTKADEKQAAALKDAPQTSADPLRIALDLRSPDAEAREKAAFALASLGPDAQPATRALMASLADAVPAVRVAAAQALGRIGTGASAAFAPLTAALTDPDPAVRNAAQAALIAIQGR
jgi:DNA repair exonuclease SbcCD ATPase subunit